MADFLPAYNLVRKHEGGYANTAGDAGGETYAGISRKSNASWAGWPIIDAAKFNYPGKVIPNNTTISGAETSVYNFYYGLWNKHDFGDLNSQDSANNLFDASVLQTGGFNGLWSNALNLSGNTDYDYFDNPIGVTIDTGSVISDTNNVDGSTFNNNLVDARANYFKQIAAQGSNGQFLSSWLKRLSDFGSGITSALASNPIASSGGTILIVGLAALGIWWAKSKKR